jgi:hypothetical protein
MSAEYTRGFRPQRRLSGTMETQKLWPHEKHAEIADTNRQNRHELFLLDDGQEKVTWEWDTRKSSPLHPRLY